MKKLDINFEQTTDTTGYLFSLAKCLSAVLKHSDYKDFADDIIASSGFAFRMWVAPDLCPSATSIWDFSKQPEWVANGGLVCDYTERLWGQENIEEERRKIAIRQIKCAIDNGMGAVVWDISGCEWGIITGYDDEAEILFTLKIDGCEDKITYDKLGKLEIQILSVLTVGNQNDKSVKQIVADTKKLAVSHLRGEEWCDNAQGIAAYNALCNFISEKLTSDETWQLEYYLGTYAALKWYAWQFFDKYEEKECAQIYECVYKAWQAAFDIAKSGDVTNELARKEIVDLLMEAKNAEQKFLSYVGELQMENMRREIAEVIGINITKITTAVEYQILESVKEDGYIRQKIEYDSCGDKVSAFLLLPETLGNNPAILINHQHNREHQLGKSEVCGLAGNPLQAFGPELAKRGFVVLAPDAICFEERREDPSVEGFDFWQHFHEMCYRILKGDYLMKKVLEDAMNGITLLSGLEFVDNTGIGTLGHSMGGNTVLFLAALDERIAYSCASGSACTYENRMRNNVGIEMSSVLPGFSDKYDIDDLVSCVAPRRLLIVSAEDDKYSKDADYIVEKAGTVFSKYDAIQNLHHKRYPGGHALTKERFDFIVEWIDTNSKEAIN